ncbi:oligosaccharide flippase family protein [Donghicola eburneus]|uniref:Putative secreted protein n=1 Tax=Donghicola eburneus TaxID=393278 RepID=A0A1M4MWR5_9RHOB|nr:oligosaccharide flippase family protein [Donghicola eburneus]SCM66084.1 putative secreted protein [Donghicola eburneus]
MLFSKLKSSFAKTGGTAAISVFGLASQQIASFVITLLAAGFLTAADYGTYTIAIIAVEFVIMLTHCGYFHFLVNSEKDETAVLSTVFWIMLAIGLVGGAAMYLGSEWLARLFDAPDLAEVLRYFGIFQPFVSIIGWASAVLTRMGLMKRYFLILIAGNLGGLLVGCIILVVWKSLFALVAYRGIRTLLELVLFVAACPKRPTLRFDRKIAYEGLRFSSGLYGSRFLSFLANFGTDLILAYALSTTEAGLYRFANRLATGTVDIIAQPLRSFAIKLFGAASRFSQPLDPIFKIMLAGSVFLTGGFAIAISALGGGLIETFFRPEYAAALGTLYAFALRAVARSGNDLIEPVFAARRSTQVTLHTNLVWTTLMLGTIVVFAPMGFETIAWAQAGVQILSFIGSLLVFKYWGRIDLSSAMPPLFMGLGLLGVYGIAVITGIFAIGAFEFSQEIRFILITLVTLILAGPTIYIGIRSSVLEMSIFESR